MNQLSTITAVPFDLSAAHMEMVALTKGVSVWNERAVEPGLNGILAARYGGIAHRCQMDADQRREQIRDALVAMSGLTVEQLGEVFG